MTTATQSAFYATVKKLTASVIYHSAKLCESLYDLGSVRPEGETKYLYFGAQRSYVYPVKLTRNVFGDNGIMKVAVTMDTITRTCYITFSGTQDLEYWLYNTDTDPVTMPEADLPVHEGFYDLFKSCLNEQLLVDLIRSKVYLCDRFVFCGHSAGGAVANLAAAYCRNRLSEHNKEIFVVDFGTPRFCTREASEWFADNRVSFQNYLDLVTCAPFNTFLGSDRKYITVGKPFLMKSSGLSSNGWRRTLSLMFYYFFALLRFEITSKVVHEHSMEEYMRRLSNCMNQLYNRMTLEGDNNEVP